MNEKRQKIIGVYYGNEVKADKGIPAAISSFAVLLGNDIPLIRVCFFIELIFRLILFQLLLELMLKIS